MEETTVSVRNGTFSTKLRTGGSGDPLLFLHGASGLRGWEPFLADLASSFKIYAPSHPGFETSSGLDEIDDVMDMTIYYNDFLDAIGLETTHVIGHSMGGMFAAELAAVTPNRVNRLVLVNPMGLWIDEHPIADFFAMTPEELGSSLWHNPESEIAKAMLSLPEGEEAQLEAFLLRSQHLATAGKFLWPIPDKGLKKRIHRISAPTHIVWGQSDGLAPVAYAEAFQTKIPGSQVSILPGCAHMPMYEDTDRFVQTVAAFLKG